jgi:hypothetical protein
MNHTPDLQRQAALDYAMRTSKANAKRFVWVTFQRPGFHHYPAASTEPVLADVKYLGDRHRHLFKFKVQIEIFHNDREIEFHQLLNYCESLFGNKIDINSKSVEMLADDLFEVLAIRYPGRDMVIDVAEDGECGCSIEYSSKQP